jgi:methylated-DNA-protein-cysteine methyltransferase related protein
MVKITRFAAKVYRVLQQRVPKGKVITYGELALLVGTPGAARAVGNALHRNPFAPAIPCHRVVNAQGELAVNFGAPGSRAEQKRRLLREGVVFKSDYCVNLKSAGLKAAR